MLWQLLTFWLWSIGTAYVLLGVALFLDKNRDTVRSHAARPWLMLLKLALGPLTLTYVAVRILIAWPLYLWTHRVAGCFAGNRAPALSGRTLSARRAARDEVRRTEAAEREAWLAEQAAYKRALGMLAPLPTCEDWKPKESGCAVNVISAADRYTNEHNVLREGAMEAVCSPS